MTWLSKMNLAADFAFALGCKGPGGEFSNDAQVLRYVASLNQEASRGEFVAAAVVAGFKANSSANRFRESRKFDSENYGTSYNSDGREIPGVPGQST